jgi:hypothetical protein
VPTLILGAVVIVVVALLVAILGLVVIDRDAPTLLSRGPSRSRASSKAPPTLGPPAFAPLELAALPMKWPSETPWPKSRLGSLPWPSETWTDDFFRRPGGAAVPVNTPLPANARTTTDDKATEGWFEGSDAAAPPPKAAPAPKKQAPPRKKEAPPPKKAAAPASGGAEPTDDEIIGWVTNQGLAVAVDQLRARTGWDFQKAAHHLAQVMRRRKS